MSISASILEDLVRVLPNLHTQIYFKSSLIALSHAIEDQVLAGSVPPLVIASFQQERFYRQEAHRYRRIADRTDQVYVLAAPETEFAHGSDYYERIAFAPEDGLRDEWHLIVIGQQYASSLVCREHFAPSEQAAGFDELATMDQIRRFEGIWTFDRQVCIQAAELMFDRILHYRPELETKINQARSEILATLPHLIEVAQPGPFADRLVTYLQAGQYKLLKAYRSIAAQERKERLVNSISTAVRQSLNPEEILNIAVQELGRALQASRCLFYRCRETDASAPIQYEFLEAAVPALCGQDWPLQDNPLFQTVVSQRARLYVSNTRVEPTIVATAPPPPVPAAKPKRGKRPKPKLVSPPPSPLTLPLAELVAQWQIEAWLMVPVLYRDRLLGMVELHGSAEQGRDWREDDLALVEAIAAQVGIALIQAEAYANLDDLNRQLEALERTRSNLIAITGHELRTPLSTIQVCLESLASEPDMPAELRQVMLHSALADAERLRELVQDFLTLSRLESGRVEWNPEPLPLVECVDLVVSGVRTRHRQEPLPQITTQVNPDLPLVEADGEWLVEVLAKLLDNACKFTEPTGHVEIIARAHGDSMLTVTIADTGRGIEPDRLETVFERFYQEEGALRRTTGGTGLGLAICRQIVTRLGGKIWAESAGRNQGSRFHFTLPIAKRSLQLAAPETRRPTVR